MAEKTPMRLGQTTSGGQNKKTAPAPGENQTGKQPEGTPSTQTAVPTRDNIGQTVIAGIFVILILCLFPLVYTDFYFNILETKYFFYCGCVIITVVCMFIYSLSGGLGQTIAYWNGWNLKKFAKNLSVPDWAVLAFWLIAAVSTLSSKYKFESFWGNEGRFTGLFLLSLYVMAYFCVTRFFKLKRWYLDAFLAAAMLACLFGITDYFNLNLLHFRDNMKPEQYSMFVSTFGNINTYTAYVGMVSAVAFILFAVEKKTMRTVWYYVCMVVSFFAIIMGNSDNAYLALAALFGFSPLYLFGKKEGVRRYLVMLASFLTVTQCIDWINTSYGDSVVGVESAFNIIVQFDGLHYVVLGLWILAAVWYAFDYVTKNSWEIQGNWLRGCWLGVIGLVVLAVLFLIYDCNVSGNAGRYGSLGSYLYFNDEWGTNRGYIWRIAMENFAKFSPWQKIVGFGPDTFGIITVTNNKMDMYERYGEIFDSAHNEYLQYLVTVGIAGVAAYVVFLGSVLVRACKKAAGNPMVMAVVFAVICYGAQAFVNLNLPIATPIMWLMIMMAMAECRRVRVSEDKDLQH